MAEIVDPITGLVTYTDPQDVHPMRVDYNERTAIFNALMAIAVKGLSTARPAAGKLGRFYLTTDAPNRFYFDDGSTWHEVGTNGGGGAGAALNVGGTGAEGSSTRSARSDHVHPLPLATGTKPGALSAVDKAKLDGATSAGVANALVKADASGRYRAVTPSNIGDVTNKGYVDQGLGKKAPSSHQHNASDVNAGTLKPARLPTVTQTAQGAMSTADKAELDRATGSATPYTIARRYSDGSITFTRVSLSDTTEPHHATRKDYVDQGLSGKSDTGHTHSWTQVTDKPDTFPSSTHRHTASQVSDSTTTGRSVLTAPSATAARNAIGAGTSSLNLGTTATTAMRGDRTYAKADVGLSNVDNTADVAKPVSTATQNAIATGLNGKANTDHKHSADDVTSGQLAFARLPSHFSAVTAYMEIAYGGTALRISPDGSLYTAHNGEVPFRADADGSLTGKTSLAASRITGTVSNSQIGQLEGTKIDSPVNHRAVIGSSVAWSRTSPTTSSFATVTVGSDGGFSRYTSSLRYKKNVRDLILGLDAVNACRPVIFDRKKSDITDEMGFIAEEMAETLPQAVYTDEDGRIEGIHAEELHAVAFKAIQELSAANEELRTENRALKDQLDKLTARMDALDGGAK